MTAQSRHCQDIVTSTPHKQTNMSVIVMQQPLTSNSADSSLTDTSEFVGAFDPNVSEEVLLPLMAKEFIEDHDLEWRDLDYSSEIGPPPESFWVFMCQYDCRVFPQRMTERYLNFLCYITFHSGIS
jgi:hypothetical protein